MKVESFTRESDPGRSGMSSAVFGLNFVLSTLVFVPAIGPAKLGGWLSARASDSERDARLGLAGFWRG